MERTLEVLGFHETADRLGDRALAGLVVLVGLSECVDRGGELKCPLMPSG